MNSLSLSHHSSPTVRLYSYYDLPIFFIFFILMYPSQFGTCYRMFKRDVNISQWGQKCYEFAHQFLYEYHPKVLL